MQKPWLYIVPLNLEPISWAIWLFRKVLPIPVSWIIFCMFAPNCFSMLAFKIKACSIQTEANTGCGSSSMQKHWLRAKSQYWECCFSHCSSFTNTFILVRTHSFANLPLSLVFTLLSHCAMSIVPFFCNVNPSSHELTTLLSFLRVFRCYYKHCFHISY